MVQACNLVILSWLFVGRSNASAHHRFSRVGGCGHDGDMLESITAADAGGGGKRPSFGHPSAWRLRKTKIRLG